MSRACRRVSVNFPPAIRPSAEGQIGNTDITGAVCSSLAGARYGLGEIPSTWQQSLTGWFETIELAEMIHELAQV